MFKKILTLQQWAILIIDVFISVSALFIAYLVRNEFNFSFASKSLVLKNAGLMILLSSVVFLLMKTYKGLARQAVLQDGVKIFISILLVNVGFVAVYFIASIVFRKTFISISLLFIYGVISFSGLLIYRIGIKQLFLYFKNLRLNTRNVLICGVGHEAIEVSKLIAEDAHINYHILAFLDDNAERNQIGETPVYPLKTLQQIVRAQNVDVIFIATELTSEKKEELVEYCFDKNIKIFLVPLARMWANGQLAFSQIRKMEVEEIFGGDNLILHDTAIALHLKNKRILVTGAAGSIGSRLVHFLTQFHPEIIILIDIAENKLWEHENQIKEQYRGQLFRYFVADIRNYRRMEIIFRECKPDYVFHAASYKNSALMEKYPYEAAATNIIGTKNLADLAVKCNLEKMIFLSDTNVRQSESIIGSTKRIAEVYLQSLFQHLSQGEKNTPDKKQNIAVSKFTIVRFGSVLGVNGSVSSNFAAQIKKGGPVTVTHPEVARSFLTVDETCQLILEAAAMEEDELVCYFKGGRTIRINDLAEKMIRLDGKVPGVDIDIRYTGLRPGEMLYEPNPKLEDSVSNTYNDRIMRVAPEVFHYEEISREVNVLISLVQTARPENEIADQIGKMIESYK